MSSPSNVAEALHQTKRRVEEMYVEQKNQCADDDTLRRLYAWPSAFDAWLPSVPTDTTLPLVYHDVSLFRDAYFVQQQLFGATLEWLWTLPTADKFVVKFVLLRGLDVESAAVRIITFRGLLLNHGLDLKLRIDDPEVQAGLSSGAFHMVPMLEPSQAKPVVAVISRKLEAEALTARMMKKALLYGIMTTAHWTPVAQRYGIVFCESQKDASIFSQNKEFQAFVSTSFLRCIPLRVAVGFIANEPFLFRNVLFPALRLGMKKKLRERLHLIGTDYDRVLSALPAECVPEEMGGARVVDGADDVVATLLNAYAFQPSSRPAAAGSAAA